MDRAARAEETWAWYAAQTPDCSRLDPTAYPSAEFLGQPIAWPDWACRAPDGGIHIDARLARIDVHLARPPKRRLEIGWTCSFGVRLVSSAWLSLIEDLLEESGVAAGDVFVRDRKLTSWKTLHGSQAPALLSTEGRSKTCPVCGNIYSTLHGREFLADPAARSAPLIVNQSGIFVRRDVLEGRRLPTPVGAFKPSWVSLEETSD